MLRRRCEFAANLSMAFKIDERSYYPINTRLLSGLCIRNLCGWWLVRLSTALINVICLKRGTTFATVLSMLLMRHERQTQPAGDIFEESGRARWGGWLPRK